MVDVEQEVEVTAVDGGIGKSVRLKTGETLLKALQSADVPIATVCGGTMSCGMCHVYLDPAFVVDLDPEEADILGDNSHYLPDRSRLACQVIVSAKMDGSVVEIAPEE